MLLLALDTSGPAVSVAVHDGSSVVGRAAGAGSMKHGELLAPAVRSALDEAGAAMRDLTDVAAGVGPGPFTGLRVGVVTALTLVDQLGLVGHGVCSLDALAFGASDPAHPVAGRDLVVTTDARRKEVYWARYRGGSRVEGPAVERPADLLPRLDGAHVVGRGALLYPELTDGEPERLDVAAADLARAVVAGTVEVLALEPLYLRRPDAAVPGDPKRA